VNNIQILYNITTDIKTYIDDVYDKRWTFPGFKQSCPICGAEDCSVKIGFYYRKQVVIEYETFYDIPIQRYLCQQKGANNTKHKTFSLLPHKLIPYRKNGLDMALEIVTYQQKTKAPYCQIKSFIGAKGKDDFLSLENNQIDDCQNIFARAFVKIMNVDHLKQHIMAADWRCNNDPVANMINLIENYNSPFLKGNNLSQAEKLNLDFFSHLQQDFYSKRHFLFGTNSQKLNLSI